MTIPDRMSQVAMSGPGAFLRIDEVAAIDAADRRPRMHRKARKTSTIAAWVPQRRDATIALVALLGLAAATLFASTPADRLQPEGVTIPYGDLDLSTIDGAVELERRLVEAANAVCAELDSAAVPREAFERCRMDAVAGAILVLRRPAAAAVVSS